MKTILVAEDEELLSQVYEDSLKPDYNLIIFHNSRQAMDYIESNKPDLAILDIKMPDVSGLKLIEKIRELHPDLPIIVCTAYDAFRTDYEVWSAKISDYIVKPVVLDELKRKIKKILGE